MRPTAEHAIQVLEQARPRLQPHVSVSPQSFRGRRWYVLTSSADQMSLRISAEAYQFVGMMDGFSTVAELLDAARIRFGDTTFTREELLTLLIQLVSARFLLDGLPPEIRNALELRHGSSRPWWQHQALNPVIFRLPLFNPSGLLDRLQPVAKCLFAPAGLCVWMLLLAAVGVLAIGQTDALSQSFESLEFDSRHALLYAAIYVLMKMIHELTHGLALKAWGGHVREAGILFMWFFPCPYVDASSSAMLADKRKRALVAAAGVMAEMTCAAGAYLVWHAAEPGLLQDLAFKTLLVGTLSTLAANGNPLMRFDAYYVLEDLIEIPNLASRSNQYWLSLFQRHVLGSPTVRSPVTAPGESRWFLFYAPLATGFRLTVLLSIALFFASEWLALGIAIALLALFMQVIVPLFRGIRFIIGSPAAKQAPWRALVLPVGGVATIAAILFMLPVPSSTTIEGIVWTQEQGTHFAATEGFVEAQLAAPEAMVERGQPLLQLRNPELETLRKRLHSRQRELESDRTYLLASDGLRRRTEAAALASELRSVRRELARTDQRIAQLTIHASIAGRFVPRPGGTLAGRYIRQGEAVAHVIPAGQPVITAVIPQSDIGRLREGIRGIQVRLAEAPFTEYPGKLLREAPEGSVVLPSRALGTAGGGQIPVDPRDPDGLRTNEEHFALEIGLPSHFSAHGVGGRAFIRLDHGNRPAGAQMAHALRQILLTQLGI